MSEIQINAIKKIPEKKEYSKPRLQTLGVLASVTLGPTPGGGESGAPGVLRGA